MNDKLEYKILHLPNKPGIYIFKNYNDIVIYVGKSRALKKRVLSYFQNKNHTLKTRLLVQNIADLDYIVTTNEVEAFILEDSFIKKYQPQFNIQLKDDKTYPYIKITVKELYPRIFISRNKIKDGNKYFGPYVEISKLKKSLEFIHKYYGIRTCKLDISEGKLYKRPCLNYQMKKCSGCCIGAISPAEYRKYIDEIIDFLMGKQEKLLTKMFSQMQKLSKELRFEEANEIKKRYSALKNIAEQKQLIVNDLTFSADVVNYFYEHDKGIVIIFQIREGKLQGYFHKLVENLFEEDENEILYSVLIDYYNSLEYLPQRIYIPNKEINIQLMEDFLYNKFNKKVKVIVPRSGIFVKLIKMAYNNAKSIFENFTIKENLNNKINSTLIKLKEILDLPSIPKRIEGMDISNFGSNYSVGSLVVFENGKPYKKDYRRFKMRSVDGQNDFASMMEMMNRHCKKIMDGSFPLPDLILIDGGKGQLSSAKKILDKYNLNIPLIGLAKKFEEIYTLYSNQPLQLDKNSEILLLLRHIRDEAHRFAITYTRKIRDNKFIHSELEQIEGIGSSIARKILKVYSLDKIKSATYEEIASLNGIGPTLAKKIFDFFHSQ